MMMRWRRRLTTGMRMEMGDDGEKEAGDDGGEEENDQRQHQHMLIAGRGHGH